MSNERPEPYVICDSMGNVLAELGPFPEDAVQPCAVTGEPVYESGMYFELADGQWVSREGILKMFEWSLKHSMHCVPNEFILQDLFDRFASRKVRKGLSKKTATAILHKYNFSCVKCGTKDRLQVDHIVPVKRGGKDELTNLQVLCQPCNLRKGTMSNEEFMRS